MQHIELTSVNLTQNSKNVVINDSNVDLSTIPQGYLLFIQQDGLLLTIKSAGDQSIELENPFPFSDILNRKALVVETVSQSNDLMSKLSAIHDKIIELSATREDVFTSANETLTYIDRQGVSHTISTHKRFENLITDVESASGSIKANRAITAAVQRVMRQEQYGASGFVEFGKIRNDSNYNVNIVNEGLTSRSNNSAWANSIVFGVTNIDSLTVGSSTKNVPEIVVSGIKFTLERIGTTDTYISNKIKLPDAPDGLDRADGNGRFADLAAAIVAGGNDLSQSKINRQDLPLIRSKWQDISTKVYPLGGTQHGKNTYTCEDGTVINLVVNPDQIECRMFDDNWNSDTATTGYIVDWPNLNQAQRDSLYADSRMNLEVKADGTLRQRIYQAFTHSCLGNYGENDSNYDVMVGEGFSQYIHDFGLYTKDGWDYVPVCLVQRRNQGAKHDLNPAGANKPYNVAKTGSAFWYQDTFATFDTVAKCFDPNNVFMAGWGNIASGNSGRDNDGRYYDAIYAGDIRDMRLDVSGRHNHITAVETLFSRLKNGTARGREGLPFTQVWTESASADNYPNKQLKLVNISFGYILPLSELPFDFTDGDKVYAVDGSTVTEYRGRKVGNYLSVDVDSLVRKTGVYWIIPTRVPIYQHGNEYYQTDIIAPPSSLATLFPNGVVGRWLGQYDGSSQTFKMSKKITDTVNYTFSHLGDGTDWSVSTAYMVNFANANNSYTATVAATRVAFLNYKTHANALVDANNSEVYQGYLTGVFGQNDNRPQYGSILSSNLIGKVPTGQAANTRRETNITLLTYDTGSIHTDSSVAPQHNQLELNSVDSPAAKAFAHGVLDGGPMQLHVKFKELVFDSGADAPNDLTSLDGTTTQSYTAGDYYKITGLDTPIVVLCLVTTTNPFNAFTLSGDSWLSSTGTPMFKAVELNGFGDDNEFIIADGTNVTPDLNGNDVLHGTKESEDDLNLFVKEA